MWDLETIKKMNRTGKTPGTAHADAKSGKGKKKGKGRGKPGC